MGLRIRTNTASINAQRRLEISTHAIGESNAKLASGMRINKSADDAAGLAISDRLSGNIRSLKQAKRNANDGISMLQVAEGGMSEMSNILIRLRELATQSASDTIGNTERSFTNKEYQQLVHELDRIAESTEFNGLRMLKGQEGVGGLENISLHIGAGDGSIPNVDDIKISVENFSINPLEDLGLNTEAEIGPINPEDDFSRDTAASKLTVIDDAITTIQGKRAVIGSTQNRLQTAVNNIGIFVENSSAAYSRIRDVDFAEETANFTQQRILQQSGVSVLAQANQQPEIALSLLR